MTFARLKRTWLTALALGTASYWGAVSPALAEESCPDTTQDIDTDRPDVTNSSLVVPRGSLQAENGVNWTGGRDRSLDGPNTRLRLGISHCTEILVDLPNYTAPLSGRALAGFSDIAPAIKRQFEELPDGLTASVVLGALLPSGSERISGLGYAPYIQLPWSQELPEEWKINGMVTATWFQGQADMLAEQVTLSLARDLGPDADIFWEYIGDDQTHETFRSSLNFGGSYRLTKTQQIDFHVGFGLSVPGPFFGVGYSWRFDDLF